MDIIAMSDFLELKQILQARNCTFLKLSQFSQNIWTKNAETFYQIMTWRSIFVRFKFKIKLWKCIEFVIEIATKPDFYETREIDLKWKFQAKCVLLFN